MTKFKKGMLCRVKDIGEHKIRHGALSWSGLGERLTLSPGDLVILLEKGTKTTTGEPTWKFYSQKSSVRGYRILTKYIEPVK